MTYGTPWISIPRAATSVQIKNRTSPLCVHDVSQSTAMDDDKVHSNLEFLQIIPSLIRGTVRVDACARVLIRHRLLAASAAVEEVLEVVAVDFGAAEDNGLSNHHETNQ